MQPFIRFAVMAALAWVAIDGDTVRAPYGVTYRLEGYDAPETRFAQCDYERELGERATRRLEELMSKGRVRLIEKGRRDKYGARSPNCASTGATWPRSWCAKGWRGAIRAESGNPGAASSGGQAACASLVVRLRGAGGAALDVCTALKLQPPLPCPPPVNRLPDQVSTDGADGGSRTRTPCGEGF